MGRKAAEHRQGKTPDYFHAMYRGLITDLLGYEKITTTEPRAKHIRPMAEKIITLGKEGTLHARRQALSVVYDEKVVAKVFGDVAKRYADRKGGYIRIVKLGNRAGDNAPMVQIELIK
jgi:large subunit ribosomal protein L17